MRIFFSAGEPSGDLHGANLIRDLREQSGDEVECVGFGGPKMADAGCRLHFDLTELAVMGLIEPLKHISTFWSLYRSADRYFHNHHVDAVVLIDYPGFNWWIAKAAKAHGVPVFYYGAPQMWAWARWRVKKMRRLVDHVLCKLPFEKDWYSKHGCNATYVGHPYYDDIERTQLDAAFVEKLRSVKDPLVAILPGSRTRELVSNLPTFLKTVDNIRRELPNVRFAVGAFNERLAKLARTEIAERNLNVDVYVGRTSELMAEADCCMACSGSVSLELLHYAKPTVILYKVQSYNMMLQWFFRKVKYITLVNLLAADDPFDPDVSLYDPNSPDAAKAPFPEYLTSEDKSDWIAYHVIQWLTDESQRNACVDKLIDLRERYAQPGASRKAADYILGELTAAAPAQQLRPAA
ncbi:lipid-A-disaccharide synthase [Lignipirellula cremea]|uniref:Lipid-A-disaccharide synthase n=1 Tax=Lignipirellula cremea TaxID=2528010 RepID=A0A518DS49_9BACT|nr:lipid-A-disaccharide synthase [Lignipirellula cremea]QDU94662.1 Glycosyl transferase [Lignipirellula cremea]